MSLPPLQVRGRQTKIGFEQHIHYLQLKLSARRADEHGTGGPITLPSIEGRMEQLERQHDPAVWVHDQIVVIVVVKRYTRTVLRGITQHTPVPLDDFCPRRPLCDVALEARHECIVQLRIRHHVLRQHRQQLMACAHEFGATLGHTRQLPRRRCKEHVGHVRVNLLHSRRNQTLFVKRETMQRLEEQMTRS